MKSLKIPGFAPSQPLGYYVSKKLFSKYSQNAIIFLKNLGWSTVHLNTLTRGFVLLNLKNFKSSKSHHVW